MLRSMTGYGQAEIETSRYQIKVEFKALNNKFLELNLRLPKVWQNKDLEIRRELQRMIERGSCQVNIQVLFKRAEDQVMPINKEVASFYLSELAALCKNNHIDSSMLAAGIFSMPNLFLAPDDESSEEDTKILMEVINNAFIDFEKFRMKEGEMLCNELIRLTQAIQHLLKEVEQLDPERMETIRKKMETEIAQLKEEAIDKNRFEQELIYYIEKLDVTEEKKRLKQHCDYFLETLRTKSAGKKLNFIAQEMGREINTLGAKANHFKIQQRVVEMKDELEKIKEQINNII